MFRKLIKNKKAQNVAEYALMIALVIAAVIAMQTYAQRAIQARIRDAAVYMAETADFAGITGTNQYEPYYLTTNYTIARNSSDRYELGQNKISYLRDETRNRETAGSQTFAYNEFVPPVGL